MPSKEKAPGRGGLNRDDVRPIITQRSDRFEHERAVRRSGLPATTRHVLLTLATYADPDGAVPEQYTPSLTALAVATGLERSTVARALNTAERAGWVRRIRPAIEAARSQKAKTRYAMAVPASGTGPLAASSTSGTGPLVASGRVQSGLVAQCDSNQPTTPTIYPSDDDVTDQERHDVLRQRGADRPDAVLAKLRRDDPTQLAALDDEVRQHRRDTARRQREDAERAERRAGRTWRCPCGCLDNAASTSRCRWCGGVREVGHADR